jgi:hypothetical protein
MGKKMKWAASAVLLALAAAAVCANSTGLVSAKSAICDILFNVRDLLTFISAGLAALVITLQGLKWIGSAEDPGSRKSAKMGIIHAVVGLIIVMLAVWIVTMVYTGPTCALI